MIVETPTPPYYAVIFTSIRTKEDKGYNDMSEKIESLVKEQSGFLGMESAKNDLGITVCYWKNIKSIEDWARNMEHKIAKKNGREIWYEKYKVRICKVEVEY